MKGVTLIQEKFGELLRSNRLAILLEIAVVFVPLYTLLIISDRLGGNEFVPLGGGLSLLAGPLVNLGLILTIVIFWVVSKIVFCQIFDEIKMHCMSKII